MATATRESELLDAIRRDPNDAQALHVYADWLLQRGDTRGELVMLQHRERDLDDPIALERMLELASEHGFVRLPDDPDDVTMRFRGGITLRGKTPTLEYRVEHADHRYSVIDVMFEGRIRIEVDGRVAREDATREPRGRDGPGIVRAAEPPPGALGISLVRPEAANVVLTLVSDVIRAGRFESLVYPTARELIDHPRYRIGRFPTEPLPADLVKRWPHARNWHVDLRDLARWRALHERWRLASAA